MTDREVMQQALEFIITTNARSQFWLVPGSELNKTVTALHARLAEHEEPEPVAWLLDEGDGSGKYLTFGKPEHYKGTPLYTAPPARAALKEAK